MVKQAPSAGRLATMVLFALSCFALLLFLWSSFGGPVPLQAKGYRFQVDFTEAVSLSQEADVRISGVNVGKVVKLQRAVGRTRATIEMDSRYAPLPSDSRAVLRVKTLLGETFVALSPGSKRAKPVPENGILSSRNVSSQVEIDEVLRSFDPATRTALKSWTTEMAKSLDGRSRDVSDTIGNLGPTVDNAAGVLEILDTQQRAVQRLIRDSGEVFSAIGSRDGDVQTLIQAGDRLFAATAKRDRALSDTVDALAPFLKQTRATLADAEGAAREAAPVVRDLKPAAKSLTPVLRDTTTLAPQVKTLFRRIDPLVDLSKAALPAATELLRRAQPLVDTLLPVSQDLVPIVRFLYSQRDQVAAGAANIPSVLEATAPSPAGGDPVHYLRAITFFSQEGLVGFKQRLPSNRRNPYLPNRGLEQLTNGGPLKTSDCDNLGNPATIPALDTPPACQKQGPFDTQFGDGVFPHLVRDKP